MLLRKAETYKLGSLIFYQEKIETYYTVLDIEFNWFRLPESYCSVDIGGGWCSYNYEMGG
jgi:hypothetical protein